MNLHAHRARAEVVAEIERTGVVAVMRLSDAAIVRDVALALAEGGLTALEVTMTVPRAIDLIAELVAALPPACVVGAGTVLDGPTARAVIRAGAAFVVSPVLPPEVMTACRDSNVAVVPGGFSPTEILSAWSAGADIVKVFPATPLGPSFIRDLRGPLPQLKLMPTGGVTRQNAGDWIRAGAVAIGVGTALIDAHAVRERRFDVLTGAARHFLRAVADARSAPVGARP
jgi:2-dehydro-3-deoxyphosphogluconate aldolase / (4S)-4-hydroxy-2-oxoglutarate aldolase